MCPILVGTVCLHIRSHASAQEGHLTVDHVSQHRGQRLQRHSFVLIGPMWSEDLAVQMRDHNHTLCALLQTILDRRHCLPHLQSSGGGDRVRVPDVEHDIEIHVNQHPFVFQIDVLQLQLVASEHSCGGQKKKRMGSPEMGDTFWHSRLIQKWGWIRMIFIDDLLIEEAMFHDDTTK